MLKTWRLRWLLMVNDKRYLPKFQNYGRIIISTRRRLPMAQFLICSKHDHVAPSPMMKLRPLRQHLLTISANISSTLVTGDNVQAQAVVINWVLPKSTPKVSPQEKLPGQRLSKTRSGYMIGDGSPRWPGQILSAAIVGTQVAQEAATKTKDHSR